MSYSGFILTHTAISTPPLVPEIALHLATDVTALWRASEDFLTQANIAPPYWAFAWPGSQALARHVLDQPHLVEGRRIIDFAAGSGLAAIACAKSGAADVTAIDIDPLAATATQLNARHNGVTVDVRSCDIIGTLPDADIILCGDVCYDRNMASQIFSWLRKIAELRVIILSDPARHYAPKDGLEPLCAYDVPVSRELEDSDTRHTTLYRVLPEL